MKDKLLELFKNPLIITFLIAIFFATGIVTYIGLSVSSMFVEKSNGKRTTIASGLHPLPESIEESSSISVVLLGYGGEGHDGGSLSDVVMLAHIDYQSKKVTLISIPRDLWIELPIRSDKKEYFKINMAHAIGVDDVRYGLKEPIYRGENGGGEMAKYAVELVTGIPVDYFASVSFDGFRNAVDLLDGINVDVPVSFEDHFYPIKGLENETCGYTEAEIDLFHRMYSGFELEKQFECRYEHLVFAEGPMHMDGDTALKFVRSRHSDTNGGDFARSQRQQALLTGLEKKLLSLDALDHPKELLDTLSGTFRTDADIETVQTLIALLGDPQDYTISTLNLSTDNVLVNSTSSAGAYILNPKAGIGNWDEVHSFVAEHLTL